MLFCTPKAVCQFLPNFARKQLSNRDTCDFNKIRKPKTSANVALCGSGCLWVISIRFYLVWLKYIRLNHGADRVYVSELHRNDLSAPFSVKSRMASRTSRKGGASTSHTPVIDSPAVARIAQRSPSPLSPARTSRLEEKRSIQGLNDRYVSTLCYYLFIYSLCKRASLLNWLQ